MPRDPRGTARSAAHRGKDVVHMLVAVKMQQVNYHACGKRLREASVHNACISDIPTSPAHSPSLPTCTAPPAPSGSKVLVASLFRIDLGTLEPTPMPASGSPTPGPSRSTVLCDPNCLVGKSLDETGLGRDAAVNLSLKDGRLGVVDRLALVAPGRSSS